MAVKNDLQCTYDGVCIYATIVVKPSLITRCILAFINLALITSIIIFTISNIIPGIFAFLVIEIFIIKFTLWNLFGEERLIINTKSLNYQQHYGFFTTSLTTITFHKKIFVRAYSEVVEDEQKLVKLLVESYNDAHLPEVIYHSVLNITEDDFERLTKLFDQLYIDQMVTNYEMPQINLN